MQLAVSTVIFALREPDRRSARTGADAARPVLSLPLVCRVREPYDGYWALPGGPLHGDEGLTDAAARTLEETTGLRPTYLEQLYAFGEPDRSGGTQGTTPCERVVSIVYWALVSQGEAARARVGQNVRWLAADQLPDLAFDHNLIVDYALWRLRTKVEYSRIAHAFLGDVFTLRELREVHELVLQRTLDPANFRRQVEASDAVVPTEFFRTGGRHRPARLYRYNTAIAPVDLGPLARTTTRTDSPTPDPSTTPPATRSS
ncbi:NUDIX hydrolase [Ruania halotolerans]|uniref:NUDIX hydrolase n=1 Tax=Ruania halotolerans TaxID=2897773 RepID=UPI001E41CEC9|nr:NUDIX domain-containing protein [Ruania halotolerans]UFU07417.1 NUDIX domain-containing protein [Ruania halotolerans]